METKGCVCAVAVVCEAWAGMQWSKRIGGIADACIDIVSNWQKSQIFISAEKVDMGIAKYDNSIILVMV